MHTYSNSMLNESQKTLNHKIQKKYWLTKQKFSKKKHSQSNKSHNLSQKIQEFDFPISSKIYVFLF